MHDVNTEREKLIYNMFLTSTFHFQSEGDFEMTTLLRSDMKNVLNLLLLHLYTHRELESTGWNKDACRDEPVGWRGEATANGQ